MINYLIFLHFFLILAKSDNEISIKNKVYLDQTILIKIDENSINYRDDSSKEKCPAWLYSKYSEIRLMANTSLCKQWENIGFCTSAYDSNYCSDLNCLSLEYRKTCVSNIESKMANVSIELDISKMAVTSSMLIIIQMDDKSCRTSKICRDCSAATQIIRYGFNHCEDVPVTAGSRKIFKIGNFHQINSFSFYLIPLSKTETKFQVFSRIIKLGLSVIFIILLIWILGVSYYLYRKGCFLILKRYILSIFRVRVVKRFLSKNRTEDIYANLDSLDLYQFLPSEYKNVEDKTITNSHADAVEQKDIYEEPIANIEEPPRSNQKHSKLSLIPFSPTSQDTEYIVCENPSKNDIVNFWWLIWSENVSIIIMITSDHYNWIRYWPNAINIEENQGEYLTLSVVLKEEIENENHIERKFNVTNTIKSEGRIIYQIQIHNWGTFATPVVDNFYKTILRFHVLKTLGNSAPYLVHSSIGVNGVGAFIIADKIVDKILNNVKNVTICQEIIELQAHSNVMIQQKAQYMFIEEFVDYFTRHFVKGHDDCNQDNCEM